ncbi:MAG: hypothetical protein ACRCVN_04305 [Spirochaetia bacterium]
MCPTPGTGKTVPCSDDALAHVELVIACNLMIMVAFLPAAHLSKGNAVEVHIRGGGKIRFLDASRCRRGQF